MDSVGVANKCRRGMRMTMVVSAALGALALPAIELGARAGVEDESPLPVPTQNAADGMREGAETREEGEGKQAGLPEIFKGLTIGALGYIDYSAGETGAPGDTRTSFNQFNLTRGYVTVQKAINPWLGVRVTTDITRDNGSWETRIKYMYVELTPGGLGPLTGMKSELGQGHVPWLDFEEHINPYRCQGTMAVERAGVFNSADLGVSLRGNFGRKLADAKARTGNSHYDGRYGTWHIGVYNGGGYHATENNENKVVEGRFTVRPVPKSLPGLQLSYFGITGKGNVAVDAPDYRVDLGMISYEHPSFILTGQYFQTKGNAAGSWVYAGNEALHTAGNSFFGTYRFPVLDRRLAVFGRRDHFDADDNRDIAQDATYDLYVAGLSYNVYKSNLVILDYEWASFGADSGGLGDAPVVGNDLGDDQRVQFVYQFAF